MTRQIKRFPGRRLPGGFWAGCVVGLVVGVATMAAVLADRLTAAPVATGTTAPVVVPVTETQQAASTAVALTVRLDTPQSVFVQRSGTLTAVGVTVGQQVTDGMTVGRIDGRPVVAMASVSPLFRDLAAGDSGSDVTVLETWLAGLGLFDVTPDDWFGSATTAAVQRWQSSIGEEATGSLELGSVAWIGSSAMTVGTVSLVAGQSVNAGEAFFTGVPEPVAVDVAEPPGGIAQAGDQVLVVGDVRVPYQVGSAAVTTEQDVAAISGALGPSGQGLGRVTDASATTVKLLPASAIVTDATGRTCVYPSADGPPTPVTPLGGGLGGVTVGADFPLTEVLANPTLTRTELTCG